MSFLWLLLAVLVVVLIYVLRNQAIVRAHLRFQNSKTTLFEKYGGLQTIMAVVDLAVTNLLAEPSLAGPFAVVGQPNHRSGTQLKSCLDLQFATLFGGPFVYPSKTFTRGVCVDARNMKESHRGLKITTAQFNTFVSVLAKTLLDAGVSEADVNAVAPGLKAMLTDIVEVQ
jgi:hypothetical protein